MGNAPQVIQGYSVSVPQYQYPAGSVEVPVYGTAVSVSKLFQQQTPVTTAVPVQATSSTTRVSGFTQDQLKTIFPMGAPADFEQPAATVDGDESSPKADSKKKKIQ